jgi:hypothetical protein
MTEGSESRGQILQKKLGDFVGTAGPGVGASDSVIKVERGVAGGLLARGYCWRQDSWAAGE